MKVLSLCDGISCAQLALKNIGITPDIYIASEICKPSIKITQKNFPNTVQIGDLTKIPFISGIDLFCCGFPCQSLSSINKSKKAKGVLQGESSLFWKCLALFHASQAKYFLFENVKSMDDFNKSIISKAIGIDPILLNSADFGIQNRNRYFWTNIPIKQFDKNSDSIGDLISKNVSPDRTDQDKVDLSKYDLLWKSSVNKDTLIKNIAHNKANRIRNRVVSFDSKAYCLTKTCSGKNNKHSSAQIFTEDKKTGYCLTINDKEFLFGLPYDYTKADGVSTTQRGEAIGNGWDVKVISHIFKGIL